MDKRVTCSILLALCLNCFGRFASGALLSDAKAALSVPKGNAAWLYPETMQQINDWKANLTAYNLAAGQERAIRVLYVYSMDLYASPDPKFKPIMGKLTETAATAFRSIPYVTHVGAIVDAYFSKDDYSDGDFNSLSAAQLQYLADAHARLYCNSTLLDGIQLDLEPYSAYKTPILTFIRRLSQNLRDTAFCPKAPNGKFLSFFVGPRQATADLYNALGPNGYAIVSGYDLDSPGVALPETPQAYKTNLASCLAAVKANAALSPYGKYSVGLPVAASACEFEVGINVNDPSKTIKGYPMYHATQPSYIPNAFAVLNSTLGPSLVNAASPYLGVTVWGFLSRDVKVSGYRHTPKSPFDTPGMLGYLAKNMPAKKLA